MTQKEEEEGGIESLIREYQQNAVPDTRDLRLIELYGGTEWRTSERDDVKQCIQRILVRKGQGVTERNLESEDKKKGECKEERNQESKDVQKEEDVEETSKAREGWDKKVITPEDEVRGGRRVEKEGCVPIMEEGRQTGTRDNWTGDVVRQIGGYPTRGGQGDTSKLAQLTNNAAGIPAGQTGTSYNPTQGNLIGQVVKSIPDGQTGTSYV